MNVSHLYLGNKLLCLGSEGVPVRPGVFSLDVVSASPQISPSTKEACHQGSFLGFCSLIEKLLCTSVNISFINPRGPKMANTTQMSMAIKMHSVMCEACRLLETGLLQAVMNVFHVSPFHALRHPGEDLALPFQCPPSSVSPASG